MSHRLAILNSHPIQYFAPLYRRINQEDDIDLTVYYCTRRGVDAYVDEGFGKEMEWDTPLLNGYSYRFLPRYGVDDPCLGAGKEGGDFFGLFNPSIILELLRQRYDALWVHGHNYLTYHLAIATSKCIGTAVFMRCETHRLLDLPFWKEHLRTPLMSTFYQMCDGMLAIGSRNRDFYRSLGVPDDRIFHVPYTVDNRFFSKGAKEGRQNPRKVRTDFGIPPDKTVVLFASKFTDRKRPDDLLRAFDRVQEEIGDAALVYAGSGPLEENLRSIAEKRGIPNVYFLGFRNQSELPRIYGSADVFVLPSENEPWGLVINEAMAAGLPVIATREVGAAADLVQDDVNGFTYSTGDTEALSHYLKVLLADDDRREEMGQRSREIIDRWSYDECIDGVRTALSAVSKD